MLKIQTRCAATAIVVGCVAALSTAATLMVAPTPASAAGAQDAGSSAYDGEPTAHAAALAIEMALADPGARRVRTNLVRATALALVLSDSLPRPKCGAQWQPSPEQARRLRGELGQLLHTIRRHEAGNLGTVRAALGVLGPVAASRRPAAISLPTSDDIYEMTDELVAGLRDETGQAEARVAMLGCR